MPLTINKIDTNLNENNYVWEVKQKIKLLQKELKAIPERKNFAYFCFWVLTPAYEDFIQEKFKKEKWVDVFNDDIDNDDKQIFPKWEKTWIKYFNEFINGIKTWKVKVQVNTWWRDFKKNMKIFYSLNNNVKLQIFKMIYEWMYNFNSISRNIRTTVKIDLDKLKKEIK